METIRHGGTEYKLIVEMVFGSHLYGTNTPNSDKDFKGIYLPEKRDILLGRVQNTLKWHSGRGDSKNTKKDIDRDVYSLQYFVLLGQSGDTNILDMIHAPVDYLLASSPIWDSLVANRHRFYTRSLKALVGYARRQAAKYGIKGSRLNAMKAVSDFLADLPESDRLRQYWDDLPEGEYIHKLPPPPEDLRFRVYQVAGRKYTETIKIQTIAESVNLMLNNYGKRANDAAENKNIDWKALSHAIRAAMEVKEILEDQTITFPLKEREYLKLVKLGKLDYTTEVAPKLESMMDEIEILAAKSSLPIVADKNFWDNFVLDIIEEYVL